MNYPIWELYTIGGGSLIAVISILHVYISHLAVGGGMFIWLTDMKGYRDNDPLVHDYVRKHTWFFLLLTMVFGGISGVGIWFIIALVNPAATSSLIHNYVFGWAIEWVFFVGEITALLIYHYRFSTLERKARLNIAFLYFLFAWLSLVVINGILSFMLTPGKWLETRYFWHGFFNPTYFPSLFFRSFIAAMVAGLFGYVTSVYMKAGELRERMMKYCSKWLLFPLPGLILSGIWYFYSIPAATRHTAFHLNPQSAVFINLLIGATVVLFILGVVLSRKLASSRQKGLTYLLLVIGLLWMGGFEYSREIARKPYIIRDYMYSTSILKTDMAKINETGLLHSAKWTTIKDITPENQLQAGRELFNLQCLACHTVNGIRNDVVERSETYTYLGLLSMLTGQGKIQNYMPPFAGTEAEKEALAAYLAVELLGKEITVAGPPHNIKQIRDLNAEFDAETDEYLLLVWNDLGMHCISDGDPWFVILPPANTLEAQLIRRGPTPELISDGVELRYRVEAGFENPADQVEFWKWAPETFGTDLDINQGLFGFGMNGKFQFDEDRYSFIAAGIPVVPYSADGSYNPYPAFTIQAVSQNTGEVLMETKAITPTSTEMGCRNCHEGGWRVNNVAGIDAETSTNILGVHDRINCTDLLAQARAGKPKLCQSCHADPALAAKGDSTILNFSAAMHGWHANYLPWNDARACIRCHPAAPNGNTRCSRGVHKSLGLTCIDCHGTMQEHALALLKAEGDKTAAQQLMANLAPTQVSSVDDIHPRWPWVKEPDCLNCHVDFEKPEEGFSGYNRWNDGFDELYRVRTENAGIRCPACHGSTHALYPADNPYNRHRDNLQPLQYSGEPMPIGSNYNCAVCHTMEMEDAIHHENMERMFRNAAILK
jgi:mono/diheme cytochrome c family protein